MSPAFVCALALLLMHPQPPANQDPTAQGTHETPKLNMTSSGMTLENLHGLPMIRPTYQQPQPQVIVYQQYVPYGYGYRSGGMGGYQPPRTGYYYNPQPMFLFGFR
jgi:hypothetical protein